MNIISGADQRSDQLPARGLQEVCLDDAEAALPHCDKDLARPLPGADILKILFSGVYVILFIFSQIIIARC